MPHPTTMAFAWEKEVQRCSQVLVCVFVFAVVALMGDAALNNWAQHAAPVVAAERLTLATTGSEAGFSVVAVGPRRAQ